MAANGSRFLFVTWDGGGNIPPELAIARRLVARGHSVRFLCDPTLEADVRAAGCDMTPVNEPCECFSVSGLATNRAPEVRLEGRASGGGLAIVPERGAGTVGGSSRRRRRRVARAGRPLKRLARR